jgi:hypothetical protein
MELLQVDSEHPRPVSYMDAAQALRERGLLTSTASTRKQGSPIPFQLDIPSTLRAIFAVFDRSEMSQKGNLKSPNFVHLETVLQHVVHRLAGDARAEGGTGDITLLR